MTSSDQTGTGSYSVTMVMDSVRTDPNRRDLCDRRKVLQQKAGSATPSDSYLRNRIRQLEKSERSLLPQLCQLTPSMQHSQRLDQRLHMLREEVRTMSQEKERGERVWRERLQRCQRQLKAKEEEMSRQSQYFENFKTQLQHKLSLAWDREQSLLNRIYSLEKQLLDMTVSAATSVATVSAVRITAGSLTHWEQQERLTSMRGEGEGEEERKEERRKQWRPSVGGREGDEGKTERDTEGERSKDTRPSSNGAKLQSFIRSLQEDLRVLLEREEAGMTERRILMEQLQKAQENSHVLGCKLEEMKAEVQQLKMSECSLKEEVDGLREENHRLAHIDREAVNQTNSQSPQISSSRSLSSCSGAVCTNTVLTHSPVWSLGEVQPAFAEGVDQLHESAVSPVHHQATAEATHNNADDHCLSAKLDHRGSGPSFLSLSLATDTINEFEMGTWFSRGTVNLEESPSEESDALRDAYRSLGLQAGLQEKIDGLEAADNTILTLAQDDLFQALNQENRALADRIRELLAHIELREKEIKEKETQLMEHISRLEVDRTRLEQENQEHGCLITELTRKTEDDLNAIMDLQQKLEDSKEQHSQEECIDSVVERVLKGDEAQLIGLQQTDDLTTASAPGSQQNDRNDPSQNNPQTSTASKSSVTDQADHVKLIQTLRTEQEELVSCINSLREQHREVAFSVQTQTEEKQHLTRAVWRLKEEKDRVSQCLAALKQEKEELNRAVCSLKDGRDHFDRSTSCLKEEKEQLTKTLSGLEREKQEMIECLSHGREERDQIMQSVQCLQRQSEQLGQVVLKLKQESNELNDSLKRLKGQRDQEQASYTLQEDRNTLMKSVSSLKEEKQLTEHLISCLKQEEKQIRLKLEELRETGHSHQTPLPSQTQTEERKPKLFNLNCADRTNTTETTEHGAQTHQTSNLKGDSVQEQSDLMGETEAVGQLLKRSQEELEMTRAETKMLHSDLCESEVRREEAERRAAQAAIKVTRLTEVASEMEETRKENESLNIQVKELQSKLKGLLREKTDTLSLKTQLEKQYNILAAQLRAKTLALEELNTEYIALKQGQNSKDDLSSVLTSLRTRYDDIRAKYDALLRRKSHTDLDIVPLKAKLSCLVVKCQERNSLLAHMMEAMRQRGCLDSTLTKQIKQLLSDAALQDYTAAFTPGSNTKTWDYTSGFAPEFISKFQDPTKRSIPDLTCCFSLSSANKQQQNGSISEVRCRDSKDGRNTSHTASQSAKDLQDCSSETTTAPTGTVKKNANSTVPDTSAEVPLKDALSTNTAQLSVSTSGPVISNPANHGFHNPDLKGKSLPDLTTVSGSPLTANPAPVSTGVSLSRRLSSPEKIMNLHEQLQKTLTSSYQAPVSRGRGKQPKKSLSFSAPAVLCPASLTKTLNLSFNKLHTHSLPATTEPAAINKSTLFNAVTSRSAHLTHNPYTKAYMSITTTSACSNAAKSPSSSGADLSTPTIATREVTAIPDVSNATQTASIPLALKATSFDSNIFTCSDTNPKATASDTTASSVSAAPQVHVFNMTSKMNGAACGDLIFASSCTQSPHHSPESSSKSTRRSTAALEKNKTSKCKAEAPAEVRSVEVIKPVGQSSLMIGWERPPLDELGCSNGTFVYGYRVFIDGDFHKSVMSSACTKCILENVDLNGPVHVSVQTLGVNGLSSNSAHTMYRTGSTVA